MATQEQIKAEALGSKPVDQLSPEAKYYRQFGTFSTPTPVTTAPSSTTNLTRVATGSVGPDGKPIYDVFSGTEHIKDPSDPRLSGVDIFGLPEGQSPQGFQSQFKSLPVDTDINKGVISDTSTIRKDIKTQGQEIKDLAAQFGIVQPDNQVSTTVQEIINSTKARQAELDKREQEDISSIEKSFEAGSEELKLAQQEAKSRAEGRTRIGGFLVRSEIEDLERMDRQHRIEVANLISQRQSVIQQAQRAYQDQDYQLTQTLLEEARQIEQDQYTRQQDHTKNLMNINQMSTPLSRASEGIQSWALESLTKYPSGFGDLELEDLIDVTPSEIQRRILRSNEYKLELANNARIANGSSSGSGISGEYTEKQLKAITKINQDVSKNSTYSKTTSMRGFADNVIASLSIGNGVSDIAAINQFQKVIDEGAVTRDQDVVLIQSAQSLMGTLKTKLKSLEKGDKLGTDQRNQMRQLVEKLYDSQVKALLKDPYVASKKTEAELYGLTIKDTILGELGSFIDKEDQIDPVEDLQNDIEQLMETMTREQIIELARQNYPEIPEDKIGYFVYTMIPDKK